MPLHKERPRRFADRDTECFHPAWNARTSVRFGAVDAADLIKAVAGGLYVVAVAGETIEAKGNPSTHLIERADSPVRNIADLKGRVVATPTLGAIIHVSFLHALKKNSIDPASIRAVEVPFPNMADQLKAGNVDAVEALDPFVGQLLASGR
jgi:NitT/TauT family transport system substrate-binding protein